MPWANERGQCLALRRDQGLFERNSLVSRQHRLADTDQPITIANWRRNMGHLIATRLPLLDGAAEASERLHEERLDVMRLKSARLSPLHFLPDAVDAAGIHRVMGKRSFFEQILQLAPVEGVGDNLR